MSEALIGVVRVEISPCPMDLSKSSLGAAAAQLGTIPDIIWVHPYDHNLAQRDVFELGWRHVKIAVNHTFQEDEWSVYDSRTLKEVHSDGD